MDEIWEKAVETALGSETEPETTRVLTLDGAVKCAKGLLPRPEILEKYPNLEHLSIAGVGVSSLDRFPRLGKLQKLVLSDNRISGGLEFLVRAGLGSLRDLDLSNNRIGLFEDLLPLAELELVSLDLYKCPVTKMRDYRARVFGLVKSLKYLDKMDAEENEIPESDDEEEDDDDEEEEEGDDGDDGEERRNVISNGRSSEVVVEVDEEESGADDDDGDVMRNGRGEGVDEEESGADDDDRDERPEVMGNGHSEGEDRGYPASRKPSVSQVPLKKRLEAEREARAEGGYGDGTSDREGDSSEESDFGDDLYKNEEDRQKLAGMTEFQREMILAERADKKGDKNFTEKLRSKRENEKTTTPVSKKDTQPLPASRGVRSSARSADRAAAKDDALNELRAKRMKQQDPAALKKLRDASKGGSGSRDFSSMKRKPLASSKFSSSSDSDRSQSDDEGSNGGMVDSDDDRSDVPTYEDIKEITIRRSKLAKWLMEPFFEELIVGCFVRVGIGRSKSGPIYRLCMVKNVDAADPDKAYKLENKTTHKYLNVFWGNETSAARWQMAMISDGHPVEEEYRQWIREVERTNGRLPSKQDVSEKKEAIRRINSFVYSAETVKQMLQEKKSASVRPMNVAAEKDRLRKELEIAESKNDQAGVERIKAKIKQLDVSRNKKGVDKKALKLYEMNKKNRAENFKNASEVKSITASLKAGEAGYDPFSRRWTRSSNYYNGKNSGKDGGENEAAVAAAVKSNGADAEGENGVEATEAALEAAAEAGKLIDTRAPIGQGAEHNLMHNFELPLSLAALQKYGGPQGVQKAFMARKQMTEATVGCRVVVNDGKRHGLTLTVSDYKRRRGLL